MRSVYTVLLVLLSVVGVFGQEAVDSGLSHEGGVGVLSYFDIVEPQIPDYQLPVLVQNKINFPFSLVEPSLYLARPLSQAPRPYYVGLDLKPSKSLAKVSQAETKVATKAESKVETKPIAKTEAKTTATAQTPVTQNATPKIEAKTAKVNPTSPALKVPYESVDPLETVSKSKVDAIATTSQVKRSTEPQGDKPVTRMQMTGEVGKNFEVNLQGSGWLYLGTGIDKDIVVFSESTISVDGTKFRFMLKNTGSRVLKFQRQDGQTGGLEKRELALDITATNSSKASYEVPGLTLGPDALKPEVSESQALTIPTDVDGQFALALSQEKSNKVFSLGLYGKIIKESPSFARYDEVLFRYASLLESGTDKAKLKEAFESFVRVSKDFPYSALAEEAKKRARVIDRTYLNPR